ncbi:VOC family protein [Spirosoma utsteinense]|uniref:3-demethylubiquinone-9 3-methyltransferase (Glyoxalase superfamily) n=1 Tax=Spirosoma utsteinense TaxID=2585773 RepID=A0ABR6W488_9BACT|nr:VOC family protein [Spirosoma utsteinense]MBC3786666.1 putative 3-demethylubiquinone-9 3-methyltransferase (glyoxalase superfamily) [Spirosoma utsteinense]MBC3791029.1 putative 3-demethylubiquinone-9 3-methyltransferase (glyoxalase superfamily) [Spirosoma utsteinense]
MPSITTFLTYNDQAEEAANLYCSIFKNSEITRVTRSGATGPVMSVIFQLDGREFYALNGGPHFTFSPGISLFVSCDTQAELDEYWENLSEGGQKGQCGWLTDKFGVSWQIVPSRLGELLGNKDPEKAKRAMQAMMKMTRLDIAVLESA